MTHYQKLATMIFRIIGVFFLVLATLSFAIALFFILLGIIAVTFGSAARGGLEIGIPLILIYTLPTSIIGFVFFKLSKKLALKVCLGLNE